MRDKQRKLTYAVVVALVAIVLAVLMLASYRPAPSPATQQGPSGPTPSYAAKGQLTPGFPRDLILDNAAQISNSYSINYSATINQYTAEWTSSLAMDALYAIYRVYFAKNGWTIVNAAAASGTWRGIYATDHSHDANVTIIARGKGSKVTVSYATK